MNQRPRPGLLQRRQPVRHGREGSAAARLRRGHEAAGDDAAGGRHEGPGNLRRMDPGPMVILWLVNVHKCTMIIVIWSLYLVYCCLLMYYGSWL